MNPESPRFDTETGKRLEQFPPVSKLEPPTLDLKIKKTQMSNDREDQRLDLEESPDVKEVVFPSQLLSGEPYMNAEKNAKEKFANEYPEDSKKYAEKEKVRIYDDPSTDPAYKSLEAEILASANEAISYGRKRGWIKDADEERRIWNREYDRKNQFGWSRFVTLYPEKAAAYAAKNELIARFVDRESRNKEIQMKRSELDTGLNQEQLKSGLMYEDEKPEQAKDRQRQYLIVNCGIDADYVMTLDDLQLDGLYKNFGLEKQASSSTQEKPKQGDQPLSERFREVEKIDHESEADAQEVAKVTRKLDPDNIRKSLAGSDGLINVKVRRSSGEIESGWFINNISEDGTLVDVVQNSKEGGPVKTKRVSLKDLIDWNQAPGVEQQQSQPSANTEIVTESDPEDILETPESKNKFVEVFKHKLGIDNIIDAASIAYNGMISEWYEEKSEKSRKSIASMELKIDTLRKDADHIESQLKIFRIDGNISEKTLLKIEAEKQGLLSELGEKEKSLAEERSNLELLRVNKEIFAKKRQESCLTYSERVKAELDPFEERITELKRTRDQLQGEAARDQAFLTHRREEASKIIAKIDAEKFPSLRRANREILKKIEAEASAFEKEIASREIAALDIGKSILKHEKRSEPLRDKLENLKRIMIGEEDLVDSVESISSPTTQITSRENTSRHSSESSARSSEKAEYFDEKELIESWNQLNGSEMMINPEMWRKSEGSKKMTMDQFWSKASLYSARFGKKERMMGMPESKKAPRKLGLFRRLWRWLFGLPEPDISKKRMKENITMNRSRNKTAK